MSALAIPVLPRELVADLERRFFWWAEVSPEPRSDLRVLAQAMRFAGFDDVVSLQTRLGSAALADAMIAFEPGWLDDRSWEFWRGRLSYATGRALPHEPPRRTFDAGQD